MWYKDDCIKACLTTVICKFKDGMNFTATMGPVPQGENCEITILQGSASLSLKDVLFGDVFVCSGKVKPHLGKDD